MSRARICILTRTVPLSKVEGDHPKSQYRGGIYCRRRFSKKCPKNCSKVTGVDEKD